MSFRGRAASVPRRTWCALRPFCTPILLAPRRGQLTTYMPALSCRRASGWKGRFDRTKAPSKPTGDCTEEERDETQQCGARHRLSRRVGGLRGLLLCLVYGLPILLLVFLNLPASILDGHVLRVSYRLGGALARLCRLLRVASDGRSYGRDGCVS
jgi:hypothetical protein